MTDVSVSIDEICDNRGLPLFHRLGRFTMTILLCAAMTIKPHLDRATPLGIGAVR